MPDKQVQAYGKGMESSSSALRVVERKRHTPPLISTLLREMLNAANTEDAPSGTDGQQKLSNRKMFCTQGFSGMPFGMQFTVKSVRCAGCPAKGACVQH